MFKLDHRDGPWPLIDLIDIDSDSLATVAPGRGGLVTRWKARSREMLFLDEETFADASKNVRGGIPVLFPSPGKLTGDHWKQGAHEGNLKQHGFARQLPWRVVSEGTAGEASVTLGLESSEVTRVDYPYDFEAQYRIALRGSSLLLTFHLTNKGKEPMPFALGLHPYFAVTQDRKAHITVETEARRAFDNVTKQEVPYQKLDLGGDEVDLHLLDHGASRAAMHGPHGRLALEGSPEFTHWVVWTLPGRDFVCLEPWTAPADALNTGKGLVQVEPGQTHTLMMTLRFEPAEPAQEGNTGGDAGGTSKPPVPSPEQGDPVGGDRPGGGESKG